MTPEQQRALAVARARVRGNRDARQRAEPQEQSEPHLTRRQREQVALRELQRNQIRSAGGFMGPAVMPLVNMTMDPERRRQFGESVRNTAQGAWRDIQQLPSLNFGQLARDTGNAAQEGIRNLPQTAGNVATHLPQIAAEVTVAPFGREEAAQHRLDIARQLSDQPGMQQAAAEANQATGGTTLNAAGGLGGAMVRTPLQAGALALALDAPHALTQNSDQPLQQRLPDALVEMGGAAAFGTGAQGAANALPRLFPRTGAQQMVQRMDRAGASVDAQGVPQTPRGVTPSLATANGGVGVSGFATKMAGDNIVGGVMVRPRVHRALTETRDAARDIRDAYGPARSREGAGNVIQQGLERFAEDHTVPNPSPSEPAWRVSTREWSAAAKADAVFNEALRPIAANPAPVTQTRRVIGSLLRRADDPGALAFQADPVLKGFVETLTEAQQGGRTFTLRDLRKLRGDIRSAQNRPRLGPEGVDNASLQRLEQSLTEDIYAAAGPHADNLRRADTYYRRTMERIDGVRRFFNPDDPSASIQQILRAAAPRTENASLLANLRTALRDPEWRIVAASIIDEMGAPSAGAAGFTAKQGFSVENFATAYRNMTPRARRIIFGSRGAQRGGAGPTMRQLADDLDNLAAVALAQKGVERSANFSGSGRDAQNFATFGLALSNPVAGAGAVLGLALTGEMLTNPAFVRWLVSAQRSGGPAGMRRQLALLRDLAARDPALAPAVAELQSRLEAERSERAPARAGDPAGKQQQRELQYQR